MLLETFAVPTAVISMRWPWISRASDPPFYGFRLLEGPQGHRRRTADHLSRKGRRSRRGGAQHVRCRPVGAQIPRDCPELAAQLGPGHPVLCVPRRGPADHLHHQRNRSLEREAASRRKNARPISNRRSSDQTALPRLARCRRGMENAAKGVVRSQNSIRHYVRRKVRHGMMVNPAPHTKFLTVPQTFIDTYAKIAFAKLYDRKTPLTAADLLNDRVVPFYDQHEVRLCRVLTDRGTEYCGNPEHHEYELYLAVEDVDHSRTKTKSPQTNGIVERFHKTVLNEFYRV